MASYVIGDTHGCLLTLRHLVEDIIGFTKDDSLYLLGDYIDRGPFSAQLLDYLINLIDDGYSIIPLRGNHEQMMLDAAVSGSNLLLWIQNLGSTTISSYKELFGQDFTFPSCVPKQHIEFLSKLEYYKLVKEKFILVHGGLNYYAENAFDDLQAILWSRPESVPNTFLPNYTIIYGHTPTPLKTISQRIKDKSRLLPLDAGCVYKGKMAGCGYLAALDLDEMSLLFCENIDF